MKSTFLILRMLVCVTLATAQLNAQGVPPDSIKAQLVKDWMRAKV